jgi:hypothetical protein
VATVSQTGVVTAAGPGVATITVTTTDGSKTADCAVTVIATTINLDGSANGSSVELAYADGATESLTITNNAVSVKISEKIIKSIAIDGGSAILIGRKANSDVSLRISGSALALRDAVSGFVPIGSYAEFQLIQNALSGVYKQEADIDLMSELWTPIGATQAAAFTGTFDGAGYTLANIYVNSTSGEGRGLFGNAIGATFNNVRLISGSVTSTQSCSAGICGWSADCTFFACLNNATVNGAGNSNGGIGGFGRSLFIACINTGAINTTGQYIGGIVAYCYNGNNGFEAGVIACYNTGNITATSATAFNIGGIAGNISSGRGVVACYSTGEILTPSTDARKGGITGVSSVAITGSYWSGTIDNASNTGTLTNTQKFSASDWPSAAIHAEWGAGDGSASGAYWKSLGSWNGGSPTYPKLFFEQ